VRTEPAAARTALGGVEGIEQLGQCRTVHAYAIVAVEFDQIAIERHVDADDTGLAARNRAPAN
jgi:hypothetical protein